MFQRPTIAPIKPALILLAIAAAAPALPARPLRGLDPGRFEGSPLFRDWKLAAKRELPQPFRRGQPQTRAWSYTFSPTPGLRDGLSVVLFQRQTGKGAGFETTHIIIYWKQEAAPEPATAGRRRLQVHRILADLDLAGSEGRVMGALAKMAASLADQRAEVKVPAPHQLTVFRVQAHSALGFEVRNQDEQP